MNVSVIIKGKKNNNIYFIPKLSDVGSMGLNQRKF